MSNDKFIEYTNYVNLNEEFDEAMEYERGLEDHQQALEKSMVLQTRMHLHVSKEITEIFK